jgi:hypothetical protein
LTIGSEILSIWNHPIVVSFLDVILTEWHGDVKVLPEVPDGRKTDEESADNVSNEGRKERSRKDG